MPSKSPPSGSSGSITCPQEIDRHLVVVRRVGGRRGGIVVFGRPVSGVPLPRRSGICCVMLDLPACGVELEADDPRREVRQQERPLQGAGVRLAVRAAIGMRDELQLAAGLLPS